MVTVLYFLLYTLGYMIIATTLLVFASQTRSDRHVNTCLVLAFSWVVMGIIFYAVRTQF
jgi:hypothetical protein